MARDETVFFAELGLQITSVDLSEVDLSKARDLAKKRGDAIQTVQANLEDYGIETESQDLRFNLLSPA